MRPVTAVVVTYNSRPHVDGCLQALRAAGVHRVVVVDNGSTDGTTSAPSLRGPGVTLIENPVNDGFGGGVRAGVRAVDPDVDLLLVNPDCRVAPEVVASLRTVVAEQPDVGICAPGMVDGSGTRRSAGGADPTLLKELLARAGVLRAVPRRLQLTVAAALTRLGTGRSLTDYVRTRLDHGPVPVDWVSGFCMYVRRACWDDTGGFDARFFMYFEDVALCRTARGAGWRVVCCTDVVALHHEGASTSSGARDALYRSGMWSYFRWYGTTGQRLVAAVAGGAS